ncbi:hypothetical protein AK830_g5973 [Neonectria ditissima]|uniref:JmjC domain-containing protein n=1 Tax=Neonectria ditissima TaxID=78410 RepID=A0A0P7BK28_9HYPO|nr:hypothetical protein AK830_g5973 [Neonectria ditissima]
MRKGWKFAPWGLMEGAKVRLRQVRTPHLTGLTHPTNLNPPAQPEPAGIHPALRVLRLAAACQWPDATTPHPTKEEPRKEEPYLGRPDLPARERGGSLLATLLAPRFSASFNPVKRPRLLFKTRPSCRLQRSAVSSLPLCSLPGPSSVLLFSVCHRAPIDRARRRPALSSSLPHRMRRGRLRTSLAGAGCRKRVPGALPASMESQPASLGLAPIEPATLPPSPPPLRPHPRRSPHEPAVAVQAHADPGPAAVTHPSQPTNQGLVPIPATLHLQVEPTPATDRQRPDQNLPPSDNVSPQPCLPTEQIPVHDAPGSPMSWGGSSALSDLNSSLFLVDEELTHFSIQHDYDDTDGHRVMRLEPTVDQWNDFPAMLAFARRQGADNDGCFKITLPLELQEALPDKNSQKVEANAYRPHQIKKNCFWRVDTVPSEGTFASSVPGPEFTASAAKAVDNLRKMYRKNNRKQIRNVRYRVDVPAWTPDQRLAAGVPQRSPIHPLKGDKLDRTRAIIPGIHTPYVYESGPHFGASFQIHAEDFRLVSLNHLYKGRKIWIVVPSTSVDIAEKALGRQNRCSQFMRHRAEFFFPQKLEKLGIPFRIVDQRPGETIVILPDAYHEGFSTGYTIAEAKNYADESWTTDTYQPCQPSCELVTAIPADLLRPLREGESQLNLCAGYVVISETETSGPAKRRLTGEDEENRRTKRTKG